MSPHALRQRMRHGNVYPPERTQVALERFFTEANLTGLRELALRVVARKVEGQLEGVNHATLALVSDRVLVLVDGSRGSGRAVRRAASLAGALHAGLVALVPPSEIVDAMPFDRAKDLREALDIAVELGARTARLGAGDSAEAVGAAVRDLGGTHLFVPHASPGRLEGLLHRSLADRLSELLPDVDIHLVGGS